MKIIIASLALIAASGPALAQGYNYGTGSNSESHYVGGHVNRDGSYTSGHYRTNPNDSTSDNYGARGNYNPYTGRTGRGY